jgi:hypothetical protein
MIKLTQILAENKLNRITSIKFQVALEKLLKLLDEKEHPPIILLANKFLVGVSLVNSIPLSQNTKYTLQSELAFHVQWPASELKTHLADLLNNKKPDISLAAVDVIKTLEDICYFN